MSRVARALPDWPALMSAETAADYLDVSETSFRSMARRAGLCAVDLGGLAVARWRRADIDAMIARLAVKSGQDAAETPLRLVPAMNPPIGPSDDDIAQAALARVDAALTKRGRNRHL